MYGLWEVTNALSIFLVVAIFLLPVSPLRPPRRAFLPYFCLCSAAISTRWLKSLLKVYFRSGRGQGGEVEGLSSPSGECSPPITTKLAPPNFHDMNIDVSMKQAKVSNLAPPLDLQMLRALSFSGRPLHPDPPPGVMLPGVFKCPTVDAPFFSGVAMMTFMAVTHS